MTHIAITEAFHALVDVGEAPRMIAEGCIFTEGPLWHPIEHYLLFSDMPGDVRRRWSEAEGLTEVNRPANKCNGMTYDAELNRLVCEHSTSSLIRERPDGTREIIASHFEGKELNSPNDVVVKSDGSIYFSDPWYGRMPVFGVERPRELGWQGVFRVSPEGGEPQLVVDKQMFEMPNGLAFSPDEKTLYINDTVQALIRAFDVNDDGTLSNPRVFADGMADDQLEGVPDGMKVDAAGNVWCCAPGGLWVFSDDGTLIGKIVIPELVANLHWGGADFRTLFMTSTTTVCSIRTKVGPRVEPFMDV
jgi:gluconolactonase